MSKTVQMILRPDVRGHKSLGCGTYTDFAIWTFRHLGLIQRVEIAGAEPDVGHVTVRVPVEPHLLPWLQAHLDEYAPIGCEVHVEQLEGSFKWGH